MENGRKQSAAEKAVATRRRNAERRKEKDAKEKEIRETIRREMLNVLNDPAACTQDKLRAAELLQSVK